VLGISNRHQLRIPIHESTPLRRHGRPLEGSILGKSERSLVNELLGIRNSWAHQKPFSSDDAYRALDSAGRLLTAVSASEAHEVEKMKMELLRGVPYTVLRTLFQTEKSLKIARLPLGLAHNLKVARALTSGQSFTWADVAVDDGVQAYRLRRELK